MNVALFGGTFDPVHLGHVAVARAAAGRFQLKRVYFVPAYIPPHKLAQPVTAFGHRYAMVALATAGEKAFIPSLLEGPEQRPAHGANYSIDTVRRLRQMLGKSDRLFFLIGIDAFLEIATWREPEALLRETEFIVVGRPGFSLADVGAALPEALRPSAGVTNVMRKQPAQGDIVLPGATIHLLENVVERVSATQIRAAAARGRPLDKLVGPAVAEYIRKQGLYRGVASARGPKHGLQLVSGGKSAGGR
ncbi:MAG: nicotinate-nucleotide adenylyltransferase [Terriglobales bacterium]